MEGDFVYVLKVIVLYSPPPQYGSLCILFIFCIMRRHRLLFLQQNKQLLLTQLIYFVAVVCENVSARTRGLEKQTALKKKKLSASVTQECVNNFTSC